MDTPTVLVAEDDAGADHHMTEPFEALELIDRVNSLLGRGPQGSNS